jgi:tetratricopeptide (TPR) repeat protein
MIIKDGNTRIKKAVSTIKRFSWDLFFKLVCGSSALVFLFAIILKLFTTKLPCIKMEYLLLSFGLAIILPYLGQFEAFGVKVELRKKVEELSSRVMALPDYVQGSEYDAEDDYTLAEKSYNSSLNKCNDFWPAIFSLASIYDENERYDEAIMRYNEVLSIDAENTYALNNLAAFYIYSPWPYYDPKKAIEMADRVLKVVPGLNSALYYKGEALNRDHTYAAAYSLLQGFITSDTFQTARHDILYELAVANSNLGKGISNKNLDEMFSYAKKNNEANKFIKILNDNEEQNRFIQNDRALIREFVKINKEYLEK